MRSKELWLVQENHAIVKLDSSVVSRGLKTYSEGRIELQTLQILKKVLEKSSQFLPSEQPREPGEKLRCCLEYFRSWKNTFGKLAIAVNWRPFDSSFERKGALVTVELCVLCGWSETPFSWGVHQSGLGGTLSRKGWVQSPGLGLSAGGLFGVQLSNLGGGGEGVFYWLPLLYRLWVFSVK